MIETHCHHLTETQRKIFDACASGNKAELVKLTSGGCDPVQLNNEYGQTPLHVACQCQQFDIVRLLVEVYGASPNIRDNKGCTPLHEACLAGDLNTVAFLLGLCSKVKHDGDVYGNDILHKACQSGNVATMRYLVAHINGNPCSACKLNLYQDSVLSYHKCQCLDGNLLPCNQLHPLQPGLFDKKNLQNLILNNFQRCNLYGDTPLHTACRYGLLNIVKYIMDEVRPVVGFPIEISSFAHVACLTDQTDTIQYLLRTESTPSRPYKCELDPEEVSSVQQQAHEPSIIGFPLSTSVVSCCEIFFTACSCGNINWVRTHLRDCNYGSVKKNGDTPLHYACISDIVDIINLIVTNFGELHTVPNSKGNTPLHVACKWGSFNAAHVLIKRLHCDPNVCNEDGETPLHLACKYGRLDICKLLLEDDHCNVTVQTSETKETPLHFACYHTSPELVKCLLQRCTSNQDIPDVYGDTPLFNACRTGNIDIVQQLLTGQYCDPFYINTRTQETPVHIACRMARLDIVHVLLDGHKEQVNQQNLFGETLLHVTCKTDGIEIVNFLIQNNYCDPNIKSQLGESPLFIACTRKQINIVQCFNNSMCNFNQTDANENTPLHIACSKNALDIVKLLVPHCSIDAKNSDDDTPLHVACKLNHPDILKYLLEGQHTKLDYLKNNAGSTPLHCACSSSAFDIIVFLVQGEYCDPAETDLEGNTALHIAHLGNLW